MSELRLCVNGIPSDESVFGFDYKFDAQEHLLVSVGANLEYRPARSLSGGERSRLVIDLAVRLALYGAKVEPTVLLVDQANISMDSRGWACLFEWVERRRPSFQTIVDLCSAPSEGNLARALCYEASGTDMNVPGFTLKTWNDFKWKPKRHSE